MTQSDCKNSDAQRQGIQVIARSALIMRMLGANPQGLSLAAIADLTGLPRSTVQRIVNALCDELLVESCPQGSGYRLGPAIGMFQFQTQSDIIAESRPLLEKLSAQFDESTYLATQADSMTNVVDRVIAERVLRIVFPVGHNAPLHCTAAGKSLLAMLPPDQLQSYLQKPLRIYTTKTLNNEALYKQLQDIQRQGIATDNEEYQPGICAFAVGLNTYMGQFSAGIVMPSARSIDQHSAISAALIEFKTALEARIGLPCPKAELKV